MKIDDNTETLLIFDPKAKAQLLDLDQEDESKLVTGVVGIIDYKDYKGNISIYHDINTKMIVLYNPEHFGKEV